MAKPSRKISLPSANCWRYLLNFQHIQEMSKINREDLVYLACRTTHCVHLQQQEYDENDGLYAIYGNRVGQSPAFMHTWLHYFMTVVYKTHFRRIGFTYLASKGLDLDLWAKNIKDGRRPDFFILFALNALLETHTLAHLRENTLWTTMNDPPEYHDEMLERCEYHLVYLGRGNFIELVERERPLITIYSNADVKTVEIGQLTFDEEETLNSVIYRGLGRGIDPALPRKPVSVPFRHIPIKQELPESAIGSETEATTEPQCSKGTDKEHATQEKECEKIAIREPVIKLKRLAVDETGNVIMSDDLRQMIKGASGYNSDETIIYNLGGVVTLASPRSTLKVSKTTRMPSQGRIKSKFLISVHGIKHKQKRSYLGCKIIGCMSRFPLVKEWNSHHRLAHKDTPLICNEC